MFQSLHHLCSKIRIFVFKLAFPYQLFVHCLFFELKFQLVRTVTAGHGTLMGWCEQFWLKIRSLAYFCHHHISSRTISIFIEINFMHGLVQLQYTTYMKQWRLQLVATPRFSKPFRCAYFCTTMWLTGLLYILIIIHECLCVAVSFSLSSELLQIQKLHLTGAFLYRYYYFWLLHRPCR